MDIETTVGKYTAMRQLRGRRIAKTKTILKEKNGWLVPSASSADKQYFVDENFDCDCPDATFHRATCKHAYAVKYFLQMELKTPQGIKTERMKLTYHQAWSAYNQAQTNEITLFDDLLKDLVQAVDEPSYSFGRPHLSQRDVVYCCVMKAYSQLSSRRAVSLFGRAAEKQQIGRKPHFNSVNNYLREENLVQIFQRLITLSALPLKAVEKDFAIDSSGFRTRCFGQYAEEKYDLQRQHKWLKAHACVGVKTNIVAALEIEGENSADSPQFAPLVKATAGSGFQIAEISADKAYSSRENHRVVDELGGRAFIPFKTNANGKSQGTSIWRKAYLYFQLHSDEFDSHYHKRSNVESTFAAIKRKFGDTVKAKSEIGQKNELYCKIIAYNITVLIHEMFELGIKPDFSCLSLKT